MKATAASSAYHGWRPLPSWPVDARPALLWSFLSEVGSLTDRLKAKAGPVFHVRVLNEQGVTLLSQDATLLHAKTGAPAYLRQVYLCGLVPLVYARSVAVGAAVGWLQELGASPLGGRVFAEKEVQRGPIEVTQLSPGEPLYRAAVAGLTVAPHELWARRSVLKVGAAAILIYECFLPELGL